MAAKGTSLKEAIKQFEVAKGCNAAEAEKVELWGRNPPIEKLDGTLAMLKECRHLALSSNNISKIQSLAGLEKLKILSLARNCVSRIEGLEPVAGTLEELWLSYNQIVKLGGLECCTQLRVLYVTNNQLRDMKELECIPPSVEVLQLMGNLLHETAAKAQDVPTSTPGCPYRMEVLRRLPNLKKLDGVAVTPEELESAAKLPMLGNTLKLGATGPLGATAGAKLGATGGAGAAPPAVPVA